MPWRRSLVALCACSSCAACGARTGASELLGAALPDASDDGIGLACSSVAPDLGPRGQRFQGPVLPPGPPGGDISPGAYFLSFLVDYGPGDGHGIPAPDGPSDPETLRVGAGSFDWVLASTTPPTWWSGRIRTSGTEMTLDVQCPSGRSGIAMLYGVANVGFWICGSSNGQTCDQNNDTVLRFFTPAR